LPKLSLTFNLGMQEWRLPASEHGRRGGCHNLSGAEGKTEKARDLYL